MIRRFQQADLECIMQQYIKKSMWQSGNIPSAYWQMSTAQIRKKILQAEVYVYEQQGHIGGFIGIQQGYITALFVIQKARGLGIGSVLIEQAKALYDPLSLTVYAENSSAVRFYIRQGFRIGGRRTEEQTGKTELLMIWRSTWYGNRNQ